VTCDITSFSVTEEGIFSRGDFSHWLLFAVTTTGSFWQIAAGRRRRSIPVIELAKVNLGVKPFRLPQPLAHACKSWWY